MDLYLVTLLRVTHIVAGVMWVGGAAIYTLFIEPTAKATAPDGRKFVQHLIARRNYPMFMNVASALTVLAGALLYWRASGGLQWPWILSGPGLGFTFGSVAAIGVYFIGLLMIRPRAERLGALGRAVGANGGVSTEAQATELQRLDREMSLIGRVDFVLLLAALAAMSAARYLYV